MPGRTHDILMVLLLCSLMGLWSPALAQSESETPPVTADETSTSADDVIYQKDKDGNWQAVPVGAQTLPSLDALLRTDAREDADVPDYFISQLRIEGNVVDEWAALTVRVELRTTTDDRWLRVPLRFDQGLLLTYDYDGDGEAAPAVTAETESGLVWLLRGKGRHTLSLSLRVPLRQTASGSQLQLSLPRRSQYFGGELKLQLPAGSFVEPNETVHLLAAHRPEATGPITALLPSDRIDLRWHPVVEESTPITRTVTNITVRLRNDIVEFAARQEIRLRTVGLPFVDVRLPSAGFGRVQSVKINEASGSERQVTLQASDREGWVRVPLEGILGAFVRIDWLFEMPFDAATQQLTIDGLEVSGADDQSGTISIEGFDRHLLTRRPDSIEGVSRIGVDELPAAGAFANLAYRFQTGSYRLVLDVDPIESRFRITPIYVLELSEFRARLSARFLMSIDEGQVDGLSLLWPQFEEQGWSVEPLAIGGGEMRRDELTDTSTSDEATADEADSDEADGQEDDAQKAGVAEPVELERSPSRWLLKPAGPLTDRSLTGLTAERTLMPLDDETPLSVHLPFVAGARILSGNLVVIRADDVEATVTGQPGTVLIPQQQLPEVVAGFLDSVGDQATSVFELHHEGDATQPAIDVAMQVRPRQVMSRSMLRVEDIEAQPQVTQTIGFAVDYGRLSTIRLRVPDAIVQGVRDEFRSAALPFVLDGQRLEAVWHGTAVELTLPQSRRGSFEIVVGPYTTPLLVSGATQFLVPVITCVDRPFETVRLVVPSGGTAAVDIADPRWEQLTTVVNGAEWITSDATDAIEIQLDHSLEQIPLRATIPTAWMQTEVDAAGSVRTCAQYEVDADLATLAIRLPEGTQGHSFQWNGELLGPSSIHELSDIAGQYLIELPEEAGRGWLGVTYVSGGAALGWCQSTGVPFPEFGDDVTVSRTYWELHLPSTQHLLMAPTGLSPQYTWQRSGLVWKREAVSGVEQVRSRFVATGAERTLQSEAANTYDFETLGRLPEVKVPSMSNSLLVFLGAGLTLVASFLLLKVPAARNLWMWLIVGAVVAVASLWYLDAILLLLQPAAYGLILPVAALVIDRITGNRGASSSALSSRHSFELSPALADDAGSSMEAGRDAVASTLVRPTAVSDSGGG